MAKKKTEVIRFVPYKDCDGYWKILDTFSEWIAIPDVEHPDTSYWSADSCVMVRNFLQSDKGVLGFVDEATAQKAIRSLVG
ncbi:MAG: hypothetical protein ACRDBG_09815 [Waterburya sp.]